MPSLLLVDLDRNFREALAISLRLDGFQVATSPTAIDGIRFLDAARFDACVADARISGIDRLADVAARKGARLILTGPHAELIEPAARRHAGSVVLPKPFRPADLAARVAVE
jgi:DNA-binding response OmpR family regulator